MANVSAGNPYGAAGTLEGSARLLVLSLECGSAMTPQVGVLFQIPSQVSKITRVPSQWVLELREASKRGYFTLTRLSALLQTDEWPQLCL